MKAVVQRVSSASVTVDGATAGAIQAGLLVLVGCVAADTNADLTWMADKLANLRIFSDDAGKMNRSVRDIAGGILLIPNFTLAGDASKGRRPSFDGAMPPEPAAAMFNQLCTSIAALGVPVEHGVFRAHMAVALVNDGPVTILLDSASALGRDSLPPAAPN